MLKRVIAIGVPIAAMALSCLPALAAPLDQTTMDYLEGSWAARCMSGGANTDFNPYLQIEFHRSEGSLFSSDGIDIKQRGKIVTANRQGADVDLTTYYSDDEKARADVKRLRKVDENHLLLRANGEGKQIVLHRCGRPRRQVVEHLDAATAGGLTLSTRGGAYFVEGNSCSTKPRSWLSFDLIGPAGYSVHRWGTSGDEYVQVGSATGDKSGVAIFGDATSGNGRKAQHGKRTLKVTWLDNARIRVQPWNADFVRCAN